MTENGEWEPGATLLGEFIVEKDLGAGSYGRVALVRAVRSDEPYAVKQLHSADPAHQGQLLVEAQRWIALPACPHVVECRFTRTIGDRVAVFSEYAPGGSLHERIRSGALYEGSPAQALRRVLTVGVQTAWGLDAAHTAGLLHLDVKPANILFDDQGAAKIADFGLAAVPQPRTQEDIHREADLDRLVGGLPEGSDERRIAEHARDVTLAGYEASRELVIATERAFTAAYVSPEQEEGRALSVGADLWSWALTLLEMLVRERTWISGAWAAEVLELAALGQLTDQALPIPPRIVELLRSCFRYDPSARPRSLAEAADVLLAVAIEETGTALECEPPPRSRTPDAAWYGRELLSGGSWSDPRFRLHWAYRVAGLDLRDALTFWPSRAGDNRARLLEDLRTLRETRRVLQELPATALLGPDAPSVGELLDARAGCAYDIGQVQEALGDHQGAVDGFRAALNTLEAAPPELSRPALPGVLNALAISLRKAGDPAQSLRVCDQAAAAALLIDDPVRANTLLGFSLMTKANAAAELDGAGEDPGALYGAALDAFRAAGDEMNAAFALTALATHWERAGRSAAAASLWEEADARLAAFAGPSHRPAEAARATLWLNRALAAAADSPEQYSHASRAVELYAPLVHHFGWHQLCGQLGRALFLRGRGEEGMDRNAEALASYREASVLLRTAVLRDGRAELSEQLASAYEHEATLVRNHEDPLRAVAPAQRAIGIWDRLVLLEGLARWGTSLAEGLHKLAETFREIDSLDEAQQALARGLAVLDDPACGSGDDTDLVRSMLLMEQGIVYRRQGRPAAAYRASEAAVALLGIPRDRGGARTWLGARRNMANVYVLARRYGAAALTEAETAVRTADWAGCGIINDSDLADVFGRLAETLRLLGSAERAADSARVALDAYGRLAAAGRTDVAGMTVRMWRMLGLALLGAGHGAGALEAFDEVIRRAGTGTDADADAARIGEVAAELRATLGARPDEVPQRLAVAQRGLRDAVEMFRSGDPFEALERLECTAATLALLADAYPHQEVAELAGPVGAMLAHTARAGRRFALAERGLRQAGWAYGLLVERHSRHEVFDTWLRTSLLRASILFLWGQEEAARGLLDDMVADARRVGGDQAARQWRAEADRMLRERPAA
ncbi:protein kinase domain-containing protein [Streptomyces swartbergensis]|uniref:protein kinase domain-containing protein n=1 Tax=Streptomyces swartbergensis TaxID=487165 RepID=UPI003825154D